MKRFFHNEKVNKFTIFYFEWNTIGKGINWWDSYEKWVLTFYTKRFNASSSLLLIFFSCKFSYFEVTKNTLKGTFFVLLYNILRLIQYVPLIPICTFIIECFLSLFSHFLLEQLNMISANWKKFLKIIINSFHSINFSLNIHCHYNVNLWWRKKLLILKNF